MCSAGWRCRSLGDGMGSSAADLTPPAEAVGEDPAGLGRGNIERARLRVTQHARASTMRTP
jgi:hypothetical protein